MDGKPERKPRSFKPRLLLAGQKIRRLRSTEKFSALFLVQADRQADLRISQQLLRCYMVIQLLLVEHILIHMNIAMGKILIRTDASLHDALPANTSESL